jgi:hypothetical protein
LVDSTSSSQRSSWSAEFVRTPQWYHCALARRRIPADDARCAPNRSHPRSAAPRVEPDWRRYDTSAAHQARAIQKTHLSRLVETSLESPRPSTSIVWMDTRHRYGLAVDVSLVSWLLCCPLRVLSQPSQSAHSTVCLSRLNSDTRPQQEQWYQSHHQRRRHRRKRTDDRGAHSRRSSTSVRAATSDDPAVERHIHSRVRARGQSTIRQDGQAAKITTRVSSVSGGAHVPLHRRRPFGVRFVGCAIRVRCSEMVILVAAASDAHRQ